MAITVFPSANAVGGAGQKVLSEANLAAWAMPGSRNYVVDGLTFPADASGLTLVVAPGAAVISGHLVVADGAITHDMSPAGNYTYDIYLGLQRDALGKVTGAAISRVRTYPLPAGAPPADSIRLGSIKVSLIGGLQQGVLSAARTPWPTIDDLMQRGSLYYATRFDGVQGFATTGTVTPGEQHLALVTAATSGASATIRKKLPALGWIDVTKPYSLRMGVGCYAMTAITGYAGLGTPASKQFIGISCRDGYVYGCRGDGASLVETAELGTTGGSGSLSADNEVIITVADGKATWQGNSGARAEASTNLPTQIGDQAMLYAEIKTTNDTAKSMALSHWAVMQLA